MCVIGRNFTCFAKMTVKVRSSCSKRKLLSKCIRNDSIDYFFLKLLILLLKFVHYLIFTCSWDTIVMLKITNLLSYLFKELIIFFVSVCIWLINITIDEYFSCSMKQTTKIPITFFMVSISSIISCPIQAAIIIPNREYILASCYNRFNIFSKHFTH